MIKQDKRMQLVALLQCCQGNILNLQEGIGDSKRQIEQTLDCLAKAQSILVRDGLAETEARFLEKK